MLDKSISISTMNIDDSFNRPIKCDLIPKSITSLSTGMSFNEPIEPGALPSSLKSLSLGKSYNRKISPGVLPLSLKTITILNPNFKFQDISDGLPPLIERIYCVPENKNFINDSPSSLTKLIQIIK